MNDLQYILVKYEPMVDQDRYWCYMVATTLLLDREPDEIKKYFKNQLGISMIDVSFFGYHAINATIEKDDLPILLLNSHGVIQ